MIILKWIFLIHLLVSKNVRCNTTTGHEDDLSEVRFRIRGMDGDESEVLRPDNDPIFAGSNASESYEGMRYIPKNESFIPDFEAEWNRESSEEPHFRFTIKIPPIPLIHAYLRNQHHLIYQSTTPFNPPTSDRRFPTVTYPSRWNAYKDQSEDESYDDDGQDQQPP